MITGEGAWWPAGRQVVRVLERRQLWGHEVCDVLLDSSGVVRRLPARELAPLDRHSWTGDEVIWRAAACRALQLAAAGEPVATTAAGVELLAHQVATVRRALAMDPVRLAICDEVGLGKTITAGAIAKELKARRRLRRVLVVAPKGVQLQWVAEMGDRFGEEFVLVGREGLPVDVGIDPWRAFDQVVCSLDAVKPLRHRRGWSADDVERYNRRRAEAVVRAGWDLVVIDEAHHVAGSSEDVARHRLARELAEAAPHLLLLSATPHSGKSDGFRRFLGLVDPRFLDGAPMTRAAVRPLVARTEKRGAVDGRGRSLFQPRSTSLEVVPYGRRHVERELYDAVTEYVREGYGRALRERRPVVGFLVLLMQRLVSSSTAAILVALEKRAALLDEVPEQLALVPGSLEDWEDLDGEEQLARLGELRGLAWRSEREELQRLLQLARRAAADGLDAKVAHFLELVRQLERQERDPAAKLLVFTEFLPTQEMLIHTLDEAGIPVVTINGSMSLGERALAQTAFREHARILVSTDAGAEGINLQFAHLVVNWDLPWAPTKIEQRIGRVDRIGQRRPVRAFNLVRESSIDLRVLEVLERKLATILAELGADKRGDVLEGASRRAEHLYAEAILNEATLDARADELAAGTREEVLAQADARQLIDVDEDASRRVSPPRAAEYAGVAAAALVRHAGRRVRDATDALRDLPDALPGEPVPRIDGETGGWWTCWEIADGDRIRTAIALFKPDSGLVRPDLAERVWDRLCGQPTIATVDAPPADVLDELLQLGEDHGYRAWERVGRIEDGLPSCSLRLLVRVGG